MKQDEAGIVALEALAWIAGEDDLLQRFIQVAGISPDGLRQSAANPDTQAGVLDFVLSDESLVLGFCEARGYAPETPARARRALPGAPTEYY